MSIIGWIVPGLIAGFIASKNLNRQGEDFFLDIILGIVGALVGGWVFEFFGKAGVTGCACEKGRSASATSAGVR